MAKNSDTRKNKHLTMEDRKEIEECLGKQMSFKATARIIQKNPSTVSYEIKHHRQEHRNSFTSSDDPCPLLLKAPFVCNGCPKRHSASCRYIRFLYRASSAHSEYRRLLSDSREGTPLNREEFYKTDRIISSALKKGQHIYHVMANSSDITCSKSTIYRHFHKGYYSLWQFGCTAFRDYRDTSGTGRTVPVAPERNRGAFQKPVSLTSQTKSI